MTKLKVVTLGDTTFRIGDRVRRKIRRYVSGSTIGKIVSINLASLIRTDGSGIKDVYYNIGVDWGNYNSIFSSKPNEDVHLIHVIKNNPNSTFNKLY